MIPVIIMLLVDQTLDNLKNDQNFSTFASFAVN